MNEHLRGRTEMDHQHCRSDVATRHCPTHFYQDSRGAKVFVYTAFQVFGIMTQKQSAVKIHYNESIKEVPHVK